MTQNEQILAWLKAGKTLTPLDALNHFGCFRLSARIYELKELGWPIECDRRKTWTGKVVATWTGKVVGHYSLVKNKDHWPHH